MEMQKMRQTGCIVLSVIALLVFSGCSGSNHSQEDVHPFDFYIDMTTQEDINGLSGESFVKGVFPFTLMIFQRPQYTNPQAIPKEDLKAYYEEYDAHMNRMK